MGVLSSFRPSPVITGTHNETERTMNPKKKTPAIKTATITQGAALASLLHDRVNIEKDIRTAADQINALEKVMADGEAAHETAIGKIAMFMRERGISAARCAGMLVTDLGDRLDIVPDHYTDLSA